MPHLSASVAATLAVSWLRGIEAREGCINDILLRACLAVRAAPTTEWEVACDEPHRSLSRLTRA